MSNNRDQPRRRAYLRNIIMSLGFIASAVPALAEPTAGRDQDEAERAPNWLKGRPDIEIRDALREIYACVRMRAEKQMLMPLEGDSLPVRRLINAVNKAAADWQITGQSVYEAKLPYFDTSGIEPFHFRFRITRDELRLGECQ